ncbi:hypothetical protein Mal4_26250 [Maioricimonas rarisocia]|uniref:Inverse autotransporter beta-domain domain-containing protein n=1 Tax=Maioricimonas rarisocia TaxID=2528026 RepID=A0A517Z729_9PLAN|nr:inverse autotransporter beta domain-containing protein [Maioricimonas rarisocia]QDU38298.1 hypothetical protein Mal4_26250 [Maioricimonas rarisocia]
MTPSTTRNYSRAGFRRFWLLTFALAAASLAAGRQSSFAQEPNFRTGGGAESAQLMSLGDLTGSVAGGGNDIGVGGFGIMARGGHVTGPTVGREDSITHMELAPYVFGDQTMLFGDLRVYRTNPGEIGGSAGLGLRHYFPNRDFVLGLASFYDVDESRGQRFEQVSMALEFFSQWLDVRANWYVPVGTKEQVLGTDFLSGSERFLGNNIVFNTTTTTAAATDGVDMLFTTPLPWEWAQPHDLEVSAGWYHFQSRGLDLDQIWGWRLRMDGEALNKLLHMYVEVTGDRIFENNVIFGADVNYYHDQQPRPRIGHSQFNRMTEWVRRNYTVVTIDDTVINPPEVAINPDTGLAYIVEHVNNASPAPIPPGDGTFENPFEMLDQAFAGAKDEDIIFVWANSVFDNVPVMMRDDDVLLGEGVTHTIPVAGSRVPTIPLPMANPGASRADRPVLQNIVGAPAVTFANENRFGGFVINNTNGSALLFQNVNGGPAGDPTRIQDVTINGTTGVGSHGVQFTQAGGALTGNFLFDGIEINNTSGDAFHIDGGAANITMLIQDAGIPANTINNSTGFSLNIQDNSGVVTLGQLAIQDDGGDGILIQNSAAEITIGANAVGETALLQNTPGTPIQILDVTGSVTFLGPVTIEDPGGIGIDVRRLGPLGPMFAGRVDFLGPVDITGRSNIGINVDDVDGEVAFSDDVSITAPAAGSVGAAINYQNSAGDLVFNAGTATNPAIVTLNGGNAEGINIAGSFATTNTGEFRAESQVNIVSMGGTSVSVIENSGPVEFNGVGIAFRGDHGVDLQRNLGVVRFNNLTNISNELAVGVAGINIQENVGNTIFGIATVTEALGPEPAINVEDNIGAVDFNEAGGTSTSTTFFFGDNNGTLTVGSGEIMATLGRGVTLTNNANDPSEVMLVSFEEVSAGQADYGIFLQNNGSDETVASFSVTGDSATVGSGGTIQLMSDAGTFAEDTGNVSLAYQIYSQNFIGIDANDSLPLDAWDEDSLTVDNSQITLSSQWGVRARNIDEVTITDNDFSTNGFATINVGGENRNFQHVLISMTRPRLEDPVLNTTTNNDSIDYEVEIARNTFLDTGVLTDADMVLINGTTSLNAGLSLVVEDNGVPGGSVFGFSMNRQTNVLPTVAALNVAWNGPLTARIQNNSFIWSNAADNLIGIDVSNLSTSETSDVLIDANEIVSGFGDNNTAIRTIFFSETDLTISNHFLLDVDGNRLASITMRGDQNVGLDMRLNGTDFKSVVINDNNLDFTADDGTAMLFDRLDGPALISVNNNVMQMTNNFVLSLPGERGIVFNTVTNIGGISLSGTGNIFTVFPVSDVFSAPFFPVGLFTDANGGIEINGTVFR